MKLVRAAARRRRSERGAAAVEMAFVLPVLLLLIFGIIDYGRLLNAQIMMTEAAREGARVAALGLDDDAIEDRVQTATTGLSPALEVGSGIAVTACPSDAEADDDATVDLSYDFEFITPVPGLSALFGGSMSGTKTITATGVMSCRT